MKRFTAIRLLSALAVTASLAISAFSQERVDRPMFKHPTQHQFDNSVAPTTPLQTWDGTFDVSSTVNHFVMVGTNPATSNTTTTFPVYIIPLKMVFTNGSTKTVFDPEAPIGGGLSAVEQTLASPIFNSSIDYVQGGTDVGTTQYEDAFQRANFWTDVMTNTDYHVLFATPTVLPEITVNVPKADGTTGTSSIGPPETLGIVSFNWFTSIAPKGIAHFTEITPGSLAIFITHNVYLSETTNFGGCCIGGFHDDFGNASSPQTYAQFSFMDQSTTNEVFSSDVSALSHELGEWMDDPYVDNTQGACGGILEVGDPLENNPDYGDHVYNVGGYNYHIQDLVFLKYFGQTPSTSVNDWWTFQGYNFTTTCQNGQ